MRPPNQAEIAAFKSAYKVDYDGSDGHRVGLSTIRAAFPMQIGKKSKPVRQQKTPGKPLPPKESMEGAKFATWLGHNLDEYSWLHVPNEGAAMGRHNANVRTAQGVRKGVPDYLILTAMLVDGHRGLAVELKRSRDAKYRQVYNKTGENAGGLDRYQRAWGNGLLDEEWESCVAYGHEAAIDAVSAYMLSKRSELDVDYFGGSDDRCSE